MSLEPLPPVLLLPLVSLLPLSRIHLISLLWPFFLARDEAYFEANEDQINGYKLLSEAKQNFLGHHLAPFHLPCSPESGASVLSKSCDK